MSKTTFKLNRILIIPIMLITMLFSYGYKVSAEEGVVNTQRVNTVTVNEDGTYNPDGEVPSTTIDEASEWAEEKGYDIVKFFQRIIQPITIVTFIIGIIMCIFSFIIKNGVKIGITVVIFSVIGYTCVLFANEIVQFFVQWLSS